MQTHTYKHCGCYRALESKQAGQGGDTALVERLYQERQSLRATVLHWLKKAQQFSNFQFTLVRGRADDRLAVDEIFSFVGMKIRQIRVWIAPCHRSRQILSFFIGDGSVESRKVSYEYLRFVRFDDFWRAYRCLPTSTPFLVGKESGLTSHVERLNNTLRRRISRLVRRALFFPKKEYLLHLYFKLFTYHYNTGVVS